MPDSPDVFLIGDADSERVKILSEILQQDFRLNSRCVGTFDEVKAEFKRQEWKLVFIAEDLPVSHSDETKILVDHLNSLNDWKAGVRFCYLGNSPKPSVLAGLRFALHYLHVPLPEPTSTQCEEIIMAIEWAGGVERAPVPPQIKWDKSNHRLHQQLCSLSERHHLEDGIEILELLVRDCFDCDKVTVGQLAQGRSGASVFRLRPEKGGKSPGEYVLKLTDNRGLWKITSEIKGHETATQLLTVGPYRRNIAKLLPPRLPHAPRDAELKFTVSNRRWYAICYDYLGGTDFGGADFGKFLDLETALVAAPHDLWEKTKKTEYGFASPDDVDIRKARLHLFDTILSWLCKHLYTKAGHVTRNDKLIWDTKDSPVEQYVSLPPYQLTARSKGWIQDFLDSRDARIGQHFFPDWQAHQQKILKLVGPVPAKKASLGKLGKKLSVVLSPVHGDLNANNILLWLDEKDHPFLIDFPFYQASGHALQDLARLEVEIKFSLMDRQEDHLPGHLSASGHAPHPLPASDHSASQLPLWQELEDHFLSEEWRPEKDAEKTDWRADGFKENVTLCFELVSLIRRQAWAVQQQLPSAPPFHDEYFPALLYQTVKTIGYPSLSVFKRLLAVYSTGRLLDYLGC